MTLQSTLTNRIERGLYGAARGVARLGYPLSWEKLEIDENKSVWASYTPDYASTDPLRGETHADLAIIGGDTQAYRPPITLADAIRKSEWWCSKPNY